MTRLRSRKRNKIKKAYNGRNVMLSKVSRWLRLGSRAKVGGKIVLAAEHGSFRAKFEILYIHILGLLAGGVIGTVVLMLRQLKP